MGTKLYVANLPAAPSALALRAHFGACGVVSDVEIVPDRNAGRGRGSAMVRMASAAGAERALAELNGAPFAGQLLLIERAPDDSPEHGDRDTRRAKKTEEDSPARITTQFREPSNMTYELDCAGVAIVIRVFFPSAAGQWRIVAQATREKDAPTAAAAARSRVEAFRELVRVCREGADIAALQRVDWDATERALKTVRAI